MYRIGKSFLLIFLASSLIAQDRQAIQVKIDQISGEVLVRRGIEEFWQPVSLGILIKDVDTILTGENGKVILKLEDGTLFTLGPNSILDIADLRKITERQLFLFLVKGKVNRLEKRPQKTELRLGKVSVVHGDNRDIIDNDSLVALESWGPVINGALALYHHQYYTNTILKLNKILDTGLPQQKSCEAYFYLGRSFEAINKPGQAIDAYQIVVNNCAEENTEWKKSAAEAIEILKHDRSISNDK
ncbi:MAG: hypothetical protein JXL67_13875 [Calditrichaeota bacterium]|nr:hypothetical protein [Calditrichota bacterium]